MSYCASRYQTIRRRTIEVKAGAVGIGGNNPIRVQSMTTSDTQDVAATVRQCIALAEAGCEIIRVTAPNTDAAKCLRDIRQKFSAAAAGFANIPLVADIHFLPAAAMEAIEHVEKVRINPGNYADKKRFATKDYSDADYAAELQRIHDAFTPLVLRAKTLGRALRVGVNHGSLSDRIMNRYGDTPLGMVESALEFLRIARAHSFDQIVLSMKSSNPKVMIQACRLLVERMDAEDMRYPLHLGVTEAGDGEDGRIKGAIGIGSLLQDGLGDTIRVSLTEDSVNEIPVAKALAAKAHALWQIPNPKIPNPKKIPNSKSQIPKTEPWTMDSELRTPNDGRRTPDAGSSGTGDSPVGGAEHHHDSIAPYRYARRDIAPLTLAPGVEISTTQPPRVITRAPSVAALDSTLAQLSSPTLTDTPAEGVLVSVADKTELAAAIGAARANPRRLIVVELSREIPVQEIIDDFLVRVEYFGRPMSLAFLRAFDSFDEKEADLLLFLSILAPIYKYTLVAAIEPDLSFVIEDALKLIEAKAPVIFTLAAQPHSQSAPTAEQPHPTGAYRQLAKSLRSLAPSPVARAPIWIRNTPATALASVTDSPIENRTPNRASQATPLHSAQATSPHSARQRAIVSSEATGSTNRKSKIGNLLDASILTGSLLCDGIGDIVSVETEPDPVRATKLAYNILQGAGARISKTEFVACPSCGRTLFDLQTTTQRIRAKTGHLKGLKLAIMGCIVNGPGEMADADFGYVGGAPGKINLYVGKNCVAYNIPQADADARLIELIKQHGKWADPA